MKSINRANIIKIFTAVLLVCLVTVTACSVGEPAEQIPCGESGTPTEHESPDKTTAPAEQLFPGKGAVSAEQSLLADNALTVDVV